MLWQFVQTTVVKSAVFQRTMIFLCNKFLWYNKVVGINSYISDTLACEDTCINIQVTSDD